MVKYRDYSYKHYAHLSEVQRALMPELNGGKSITRNDIICLNQNLDHEYILENKLYENPLLFTANPNSFDEEFIFKCFESCLNQDHKDSLIMAIKTQKVSEAFIVKILNILDHCNKIDMYYDILHIASEYVDLSEDFIKEWIYDDDNVSESTFVNVILIQSLSEKFIDEYLVDFLNCYRVWDGGNRECYGWKFLFKNPNAKISEEFFEKHNLMKLNLADYILYNGYGEIAEEYNHIDLSHFSFDYLDKIFNKACKDVKEYMEEMDFAIDEIDIYPIFVSFGLEFSINSFYTKVGLESFPVKDLYPGADYPLDKYLTDLFESFLLDELSINIIDADFYNIVKSISNCYTQNIHDNKNEASSLPSCLCWWVMARTQKITVSLLDKIINHAENCINDNGDEPYFERDDLAVNRYLTNDHIEYLMRYHNKLFDINDWLDDYEFDMEYITLDLCELCNHSKLKFKLESDLINYCNYVFETDVISVNKKCFIFKDIMEYQSHFVSENHEYFVSYIKEICNDNNYRKTELVAYLIAFTNIHMEDIEKVLDIFDIK